MKPEESPADKPPRNTTEVGPPAANRRNRGGFLRTKRGRGMAMEWESLLTRFTRSGRGALPMASRTYRNAAAGLGGDRDGRAAVAPGGVIVGSSTACCARPDSRGCAHGQRLGRDVAKSRCWCSIPWYTWCRRCSPCSASPVSGGVRPGLIHSARIASGCDRSQGLPRGHGSRHAMGSPPAVQRYVLLPRRVSAKLITQLTRSMSVKNRRRFAVAVTEMTFFGSSREEHRGSNLHAVRCCT